MRAVRQIVNDGLHERAGICCGYSHDEWSPLREVIVGTSYHLDYDDDLSFRLLFHRNLTPGSEGPARRAAAHRLFRNVRPGNQLRDECLEDLAGFVFVLEEYGAVVRIGAPSDVPAVDLAVAQPDGRRGPGYANRLQHADDLGPPSHNLTVRLHPVQVRMQQRLERAPVTLDDRGMRA